MRCFKYFFALFLCVSLLLNLNINIYASNIKTIDLTGNGTTIFVNGIEMDTVIAYDNMAFISLRQSMDILKFKITYYDAEKITYLDSHGVSRQIIPALQAYNVDEYGLPAYNYMITRADYIRYAISVGYKLVLYEDSGYGPDPICLNFSGEWNPDAGYVRAYKESLYSRIDDAFYWFPANSYHNMDLMEAADDLAVLRKDQAYMELRQFVVNDKYSYSPVLIYEGSAYVPITFFVNDLEMRYQFDAENKISYIGTLPEGVPYQRDYIEVNIGDEDNKRALPISEGFVMDDRTSLEKVETRTSEAFATDDNVYYTYTTPAYYYVSYNFEFKDFPVERCMDLYAELRSRYSDFNNVSSSYGIYGSSQDYDIKISELKRSKTDDTDTYVTINYDITGTCIGYISLNISGGETTRVPWRSDAENESK